MKLRPVHLLWAVLAVAFAIWLVLRMDDDARQIRARLEELRETVEKEEGESRLAGAAKARALGDLLTDTFEVRLEPTGDVVSDRQRLMQTAVYWRSTEATIRVGFSNVEIEVDEPRRAAQMTATAVVTAAASGFDRSRFDLAILWQKTSDGWKIQHLVVTEAEGLF